MDELLAWLSWVLVDLLLVGTGRVIVFLGTAGRWRSEAFGSQEGRVHGPAGALSFKREGRRVVTATGLALAGLMFYVALMAWLLVA